MEKPVFVCALARWIVELERGNMNLGHGGRIEGQTGASFDFWHGLPHGDDMQPFDFSFADMNWSFGTTLVSIHSQLSFKVWHASTHNQTFKLKHLSVVVRRWELSYRHYRCIYAWAAKHFSKQRKYMTARSATQRMGKYTPLSQSILSFADSIRSWHVPNNRSHTLVCLP